jgi:hypothetical protein
MRPRQKSIAILCVGILIFAAFLPLGGPDFAHAASLVLLWLIVPVSPAVFLRRLAPRCDEQPTALLALRASRAPPAQSVLA